MPLTQQEWTGFFAVVFTGLEYFVVFVLGTAPLAFAMSPDSDWWDWRYLGGLVAIVGYFGFRNRQR